MKLKKTISTFFRTKHTRFAKTIFYKPLQVKISPSAKINVTENLRINEPKENFLLNRLGTFRMDDNSELFANRFAIRPGCNIHIAQNAKLTLKSGYINSGCSIKCKKAITIGENVVIAHEVIIRDNDAHSIIGSTECKPINIGDNVWIGTRAIILKGVSIGEGAVIGAGAVVTHDIPAHSLAVGVPAVVKKVNICWK